LHIFPKIKQKCDTRHGSRESLGERLKVGCRGSGSVRHWCFWQTIPQANSTGAFSSFSAWANFFHKRPISTNALSWDPSRIRSGNGPRENEHSRMLIFIFEAWSHRHSYSVQPSHHNRCPSLCMIKQTKELFMSRRLVCSAELAQLLKQHAHSVN
jgi:hypothetical protein